MRVLETRDGMVTEPSVLLSSRKESFQQQVHGKIGRKLGSGGKPIGRPPLSGQGQGLTEAEMQQRRVLERLREQRKDCLELARGMQHSVRLLCPDPQAMLLLEQQLQVPEPLLVELLYAQDASVGGGDLDGLDVLRQVLALRSLVRVGGALSLTATSQLDDAGPGPMQGAGPGGDPRTRRGRSPKVREDNPGCSSRHCSRCVCS